MAKQYIITEVEMRGLLDSLEFNKLKQNNICDPHKHLDENWRNLSEKEKAAVIAAIDTLHRGFHFVVCRWAQDMGFTEYHKR